MSMLFRLWVNGFKFRAYELGIEEVRGLGVRYISVLGVRLFRGYELGCLAMVLS